MEKFVHRENLKLFRKLLAETTDAQKRQVIRKLLAGGSQRPAISRNKVELKHRRFHRGHTGRLPPALKLACRSPVHRTARRENA